MLTPEEKLLNNLAQHYITSLTKKAVRQIMRLPKEAMMSGDDSPLKNVWDEICVQVQGEHFFCWDLYPDMISEFCKGVLDDQPNEILFLLSYIACENKFIAYENNTYYEDDVVELIKNSVLQYAGDYHNQRIEHYLERGYELDI
jgi:hypothetical protein